VLHPYYHVLPVRRHQTRQRILLSYFKKKSESPPIDPRWQMIYSTLKIHSQDIPLVSKAYIFIFCYSVNVVQIHVLYTVYVYV
jgi:hypothetical protein